MLPEITKLSAKLTLSLLLYAFLMSTHPARAGSLMMEYDGDDVLVFEARGVAYEDLHRVVAGFAGVQTKVVSSPVKKITLITKNVTWTEFLSKLYDPKVYDIKKTKDGNLIVAFSEDK